MFDSRHKNMSDERHRCTKRGVRLKIALKRSGDHIWFNIYEIYGGKESHCHPRTFLSVLFQHPVKASVVNLDRPIGNVSLLRSEAYYAAFLVNCVYTHTQRETVSQPH